MKEWRAGPGGEGRGSFCCEENFPEKAARPAVHDITEPRTALTSVTMVTPFTQTGGGQKGSFCISESKLK